MNKSIISIAGILIAWIMTSGSAMLAQANVNKPVSDRSKSEEQIRMLKQGALIVRLKTESRSKQAYLDNGLEKEAAQLQKMLDKENRIIMKAFIEHFGFCDIYFMYKSDHNRIVNGEVQGYFVDSNLQVNEVITLHTNRYLFVEMSEVYASSLQFAPSYTSAGDREADDLHATPIKYDCLVVKDKELRQLSRPFPFYVSTPMRLSKIKYAVKKLNANFHRFYASL